MRLKENIKKFELGLGVKKYTGDPTKATKRPTFQLVHELFSILKEIFPQLKVIILEKNFPFFWCALNYFFYKKSFGFKFFIPWVD